MKIRLFDGHCDTAFELWYRKASLRQNTCHVDLYKANAFEVYAQVFAFCSYAGAKEFAQWSTKELFELPLQLLRREVAQNAERMAYAKSRQEILSCNEAQKIAVLLSVEGPEVIDCDPERLPVLREQGFCMTSLTWNADNCLAGMHGSDLGLSDRGKAYVRTAQKENMLIDVSHLSERSFWDLIRITEKPILASHSNCRALCDVTRNLTDDQLRAIAETGGTVGLNLYVPFLGDRADYPMMRRHLEHMLDLCGEKHVALGGDLDGCDTLPDGFDDLSSYTDFYSYLSDAGYPEELLDKIFYTNLLNLF